MNKNHFNAIVVGSGAGGGIVAKELAVAGLTVALMERGDWPVYDEHINDELISQRAMVLAAVSGPDWKKNPRVYVHPDGRRETVLGNDGRYSPLAACVGSGTVTYGAMAWRYMEEDFKLKTTYGEVAGSTLEDWPVTYQELEPYYEKAEWEIGVAGEMGANPFEAPRKKGFPMPPFEPCKEGRIISEAARNIGLHPFPIPMLRNSVPYNNRPGCIRNRNCVGFQCPVDAKNGTQNTVIPEALSTGNCKLFTNAFVVEILSKSNGNVKGVRYIDHAKREQIITSDIIVVSSSATESARLMLNSKTTLFPNGLGNNNDWVGRNLQGHAYTGAFGLFEEEIKEYAGPGATIGIGDFNHHNPGIIGGGVICNEFNVLPYQFSQSRPPGEPMWGKKHKEYQLKNLKRFSGLHGPIQEMPMFESRVTIDPVVKDYWGVPVVALSGTRHPLDHEHCKFLSARAEEIIIEAGAYKTWQSVGGKGGPSGHQHQCGTLRMGDDPHTSVVNKYGKVHDIDNLFVADGSVLVTGGGFNPVLTIMAVAYHTSDYIVKNWNGSKFR